MRADQHLLRAVPPRTTAGGSWTQGSSAASRLRTRSHRHPHAAWVTGRKTETQARIQVDFRCLTLRLSASTQQAWKCLGADSGRGSRQRQGQEHPSAFGSAVCRVVSGGPHANGLERLSAVRG